MQGGGFSVSGSSSVSGTGVMIYNDAGGGAITISGSGSITLSPMTSGPYAGITLFQARTATASVAVSGIGPSTNISGTFYAADASINISGSGSGVGSQYIASTLGLSGSGSINVILTCQPWVGWPTWPRGVASTLIGIRPRRRNRLEIRGSGRVPRVLTIFPGSCPCPVSDQATTEFPVGRATGKGLLAGVIRSN